MTDRLSSLTPAEHVDRFKIVRSQMAYTFRHYTDADVASELIAENTRFSIQRNKDSAEAVIRICHFDNPEYAKYATSD